MSTQELIDDNPMESSPQSAHQTPLVTPTNKTGPDIITWQYDPRHPPAPHMAPETASYKTVHQACSRISGSLRQSLLLLFCAGDHHIPTQYFDLYYRSLFRHPLMTCNTVRQNAIALISGEVIPSLHPGDDIHKLTSNGVSTTATQKSTPMITKPGSSRIIVQPSATLHSGNPNTSSRHTTPTRPSSQHTLISPVDATPRINGGTTTPSPATSTNSSPLLYVDFPYTLAQPTIDLILAHEPVLMSTLAEMTIMNSALQEINRDFDRIPEVFAAINANFHQPTPLEELGFQDKPK